MSFQIKIKYSIAKNYIECISCIFSNASSKKVKQLLIVLIFILSGASAYAVDTDGDGVNDELEGFGILLDGTLISDTLGTGVVIDGPAWETVLANLPSSQSFVESFESFAVNTDLDGIAIPNGEFTMSVVTNHPNGNVVNNVENDVDNAQYGTSPRTGVRQATFQMSGRNITTINLEFASPVVGFGLYLGDIHDGQRETGLQILFDDVLVWNSADNVGGNSTGIVTNTLTGETQLLGNKIFGFIGSYDLSNFVSKVTIIYDNDSDGDNQGAGDNFTIDDISAIFPGRDCDGNGVFDHLDPAYSHSGTTCPVTLIVNKSWVEAKVNDEVDITTAITTGGITNNEVLNSVAELATEDTDTQTIILNAGDTVNFSEAFTIGNAGDYTSELSCTGADDTNPNNGLDIVMADIDNIIECTYTNTSKVVDLKITKTVNDSTPNIGDTITFSLLVENLGPTTATSVLVTDILPAGFTYVTGSMTGISPVVAGITANESSPAGTGLKWTINPLAVAPSVGSSTTLTFQAVVKAP